MAKSNKNYREDPALNPDDRESQMISLAEDLAEQKLRDGTASSQIIALYLKRGSKKDRLEEELLQTQIELGRAKVHSIESGERTEEMYKEAMAAFSDYRGDEVSEDPEYE